MGRCWVPVIVSTCRATIRVETELSRAMAKAGCTARSKNSRDMAGSSGTGRLWGMLPMAGASRNHNTPSTVPATSTTKGAGANRTSLPLHASPNATQMAARARA